jgi:predicted Zn-dependent protease
VAKRVKNRPQRSAALLLALALVSCQSLPTVESRELILNAPEREEEIGRSEAQRVAAEIGLVEDPELVGYVDSIGQRIARHTPRADVRYRFQIADMPEPNAFALPGGYIFVSRGLLALANDEAELACVIAHEIAHVVARHAAQREAEAVRAQLLSALGMIAAAIVGGGEAAAMAGAASQAAGAGIIAAYSREQEHDADRLGQELALQAGWDPAGMASFMRLLENETRLREGATRLPSFFDSHPTAPDRAAQTAARAQLLKKGWSPSPSREDLLARTDGILLGPSPAEGVIRGTRFLHPDLDLMLRFPERWTVQNQHNAVGAAAPARDAFVSLELQGRGDDPSRAALDFTAAHRVQLRDSEALRIGGSPAHRGLAVAEGPQGGVVLDLTWIAYGGSIYRISGVAPLARYRSYSKTLRRTALSFRRLTAVERESIHETRMRVVSARAEETLEELSDRTENAWTHDETAVVNALHGTTHFEAGQLVKIATVQRYHPRPLADAAANRTVDEGVDQ